MVSVQFGLDPWSPPEVREFLGQMGERGRDGGREGEGERVRENKTIKEIDR